MRLPARLLARFALLAALLGCAWSAPADEIRLRNGKTVTGEIVGFENNMFKLKTDFGFILIEKSKVASIVPSAAKPKKAEKDSAKSGAEKESAPDKLEKREAVKTDSASPAKTDRKEDKPASSAPPAQTIPLTPDSSSAPVKRVAAPAAPTVAELPASAPVSSPATSPANPPAAPQPPPVSEAVQGNIYTNYTYGFRLYKAPGWQLIEDARRTLPNAVVAMGTEDRMTMLIAGIEPSKEPLEATATSIEERMRAGYENYRHLSRKKTTVGGLPAVEILYRGVEGERDWSGRLVVVARGKEYFTILGITFADSDLIQIQENIVARAIASMDFHVN